MFKESYSETTTVTPAHQFTGSHVIVCLENGVIVSGLLKSNMILSDIDLVTSKFSKLSKKQKAFVELLTPDSILDVTWNQWLMFRERDQEYNL